MKYFFTACLLSVSFWASSQNIKLKKGNILVDDVTWLTYEGCTGLKWTLCSIFNKNNEEVIFMKFIKRGNASDGMIFNRGGDPNYFELSFLGTGQKIEIKDTPEKIVTVLYKSKCINEDGTLNTAAVDRLVEKFGSSFSSQTTQPAINTIIIKEEPRSGVNINIGR